MDLYLHLQELAKQGRRIKGQHPEALLAAMQVGGVDICGLGIANRPLLSFLPRLGIRILSVRDRQEPSRDTVSKIRALGARAVFGDGYLRELSAPLILRTPSLRPDHPELLFATARGATVLSEVALFLALTPGRIFAVTGSDGKTTTAMMTAALLEAGGYRTLLGGNIGRPLLPELLSMRAEDAAVLELSSFQLSDIDPPRGRVAITNITENHLDWHRSMQEYIAAKARILGGGPAVLSADCQATRALAEGRSATLFTLGDTPPSESALCLRGGTVRLCRDGSDLPLFKETDLRLCGRYNLLNAMAATALTLDLVPSAVLAPALASFRGAPHRAEAIGTYLGVRCFDSSIDTTPARTAATLAAFDRPVVLLGGRGKRVSLTPLARAVLSGAAAAVLFGESAEEMEAAIGSLDGDRRFPLYRERDFSSAVLLAHRIARDLGRNLLLSPAATSFDAFPDYAARGRAFLEILRELGPNEDNE